jgi:hypothetical protein
MKATLIKQQVIVVSESEQRKRELDRAFGLAVYGALIALAKAFYRRYVGGEPPI